MKRKLVSQFDITYHNLSGFDGAFLVHVEKFVTFYTVTVTRVGDALPSILEHKESYSVPYSQTLLEQLLTEFYCK